MMLLVFVCAFVGRGMAFLGAGDATCEQTFPYLLLALFSKERKAKRREARRARHPIGYPAYLAHLLRASFFILLAGGGANYPLNACANDSRENCRNHER